MVRIVYFSGRGTTLAMANDLASYLGRRATRLNTATLLPCELDLGNADDIVIFAMPVYAGRLPKVAVEHMSGLKGDGQRCVVMCVYGNRAYDDAVIELCDLAVAKGFRPIAAGAFIARHSIFPQVAATRPDSRDRGALAAFAELISTRLRKGEVLDLTRVPGNREYRSPRGVPFVPDVDESKCTECGVCANHCPTGAIAEEGSRNPDAAKCICCMRCVEECPVDARALRGVKYNLFGKVFARMNKARHEPEWW